jgi:hypothetical protein
LTSGLVQPIRGAGLNTRNWQPIAAVTLNPERDSLVSAAVTTETKDRAVERLH